MRELLTSAVKDDTALQAIWNKRFFQAGSLGRGGVPQKPEFPFGTYRELPSIIPNVARETSRSQRHFFNVYIHDKQGTYSRINDVIEALRETVIGLAGRTSSSGALCLDAVWNGHGGDLEDEDYKSNLKIVTFELVANR